MCRLPYCSCIVCVYNYVNTHTRTYTNVHQQTHAYTRIHAHTHMYIHIYTYMHVHTHICTYTHTYMHIHTRMHVHAHICTYTHMYMHIHTHICMCVHTHIFTHQTASCSRREKRGTCYSRTMGWLLCQLSFALLRSSIMCIRGARSSQHQRSQVISVSSGNRARELIDFQLAEVDSIDHFTLISPSDYHLQLLSFF